MFESGVRQFSAGLTCAAGAVQESLRQPSVRAALLAVAVADAIVLGLYVSWGAAMHYELEESYFYGRTFFSREEWSLMEVLGYAKEAGCVLMLGLIAWHTRSSLWGAVTLFAFFILIDDSLRVHENLGAVLASAGIWAPISQGVAAVILGLVMLTLLLTTWRRAASTHRNGATAVLLSVGVLLFFAVGVDAAHDALKHFTRRDKVWALFEDGGELVSLSLMLAVVTGLFLRRSELRSSLR